MSMSSSSLSSSIKKNKEKLIWKLETPEFSNLTNKKWKKTVEKRVLNYAFLLSYIIMLN